MKKVVIFVAILFSSFSLYSCNTANANENEESSMWSKIWDEVTGLKSRTETTQSDITEIKSNIKKLTEKSDELARERAEWKTYYDVSNGKLVRSQTEGQNLIPLQDLIPQAGAELGYGEDINGDPTGPFAKTTKAIDQQMSAKALSQISIGSPVVQNFLVNEGLLIKVTNSAKSKKNKKTVKKVCPCDTTKSATAVADTLRN